LHLFIILLPCVWFEHPGHTYGGFVPSFSERGMTRPHGAFAPGFATRDALLRPPLQTTPLTIIEHWWELLPVRLSAGGHIKSLPHAHDLLVQLQQPSVEHFSTDSSAFAVDAVLLCRADRFTSEHHLPGHPVQPLM
jgi:hypothetical protein